MSTHQHIVDLPPELSPYSEATLLRDLSQAQHCHFQKGALFHTLATHCFLQIPLLTNVSPPCL